MNELTYTLLVLHGSDQVCIWQALRHPEGTFNEGYTQPLTAVWCRAWKRVEQCLYSLCLHDVNTDKVTFRKQRMFYAKINVICVYIVKTQLYL